jgi:hypothetical protein
MLPAGTNLVKLQVSGEQAYTMFLIPYNWTKYASLNKTMRGSHFNSEVLMIVVMN